jgi:redox-sensitive bicupin YhaK (pirin superfamily)
MHGFQLWANLPAALKMTKPRYQEVKATDIPVIADDDGTHVRLVCGHFWGKTGPVDWMNFHTTLQVTRDFLGKNTEALTQMLTGLREATEFVNAHRSQAIDLLSP